MIHHNSKLTTVLAGLLFLLATAAMATALPLDTGSSGYAVTEANPPLMGEWVKKTDTNKSGGVGEAVVGANDCVYIARCHSQGSCNFWRYDINADRWADRAVPNPRFKNGMTLAWDGENYIYSLLGGTYRDKDRRFFYQYDVLNDSWTQLRNTSCTQGAGDAIAWADGFIYAMIGSRKHRSVFARYNCSNDSWKVLALPLNWENKTDDGASLVWTGGEYLYALRGEWQEEDPNQDFARYNITNNSWKRMTDIPENESPGSGGYGVGDGASLLWIGGGIPEYSDYIFALGGGGTYDPEHPGKEPPGYNFYCYNISKNNWTRLKSVRCPVGKWVGNRLGFANGHIYYWQGAPSNWTCGGNAFFMFVPKPTALITTDKTTYTTGDTMTITINISNPTEGSVTFQWYWGVPRHSIWTSVMSVPIPEGYDDTHDFSFTIPDWGSTPFGNVFYVQLLNANGGILDAEAECWAYSPSGEVALAVDIREKIKKAIKWWSSDEERKGNEI
jgi:hypothetical protein